MRSRFRAFLSRVARLGQRIGWPSDVEQRYSASESVVEMCWDAAAASQAQLEMMGWLDSPIVRNEYVLPQLFSERGSDYWVREVVEHYSIPRDGAWLSLGSGTGKHEVRCRQEGLCAAVDAYDIAPEAVGIARRAAQAAGVQGTNFQVRDFEEMNLPSEHYDVVFAAMALHHMRDLEAVVQRIKGSLKLGGWLIADEYVGPSRFQFPDHQVTVINELLSLHHRGTDMTTSMTWSRAGMSGVRWSSGSRQTPQRLPARIRSRSRSDVILDGLTACPTVGRSWGPFWST